MTKLKNLSLIVGLLLAASLSHAQSCTVVGTACQIPNTTLSSAVSNTSSQNNTFKLASTTGIVAGVTMLYVEGEMDSVEAVTTTPATVTVVRGVPTSRVSSHPSGAVVWYGPPSYFQFQVPVGYPAGSCTRNASLIVPYIDTGNNIFSDCVGGVWVRGVSGQATFRVLAPNTGAVAYSTPVGTNTTLAATTMYCTEIDLPYNKLLTGIGVMNGATASTDKHLVAFYDASGNLVVNSATAGATAAGANTYQNFAFTSQYLAVGPAQYFGCVQTNGTTATLNLLTTGTQDTYLTKGVTGQTFGTIPSTITVPTTFTTVVGPYLYLY